MIKKNAKPVIPAEAGIHPNRFRLPRLHLAMTALVVIALTFVGLTAITGPTQQANATAQSDYYDTIAARWNTDNPVIVNFCGYKWDIVGINDDGSTNKVGIGTAGDTANDGTGLPTGNVTLLLDKSNTIVPIDQYVYDHSGVNNNYNESFIQPLMNSTIYGMMSGCSDRANITQRTLVGGGDNPDHIKGSNVENQNLWPLSAAEVNQFSTDGQRLFPNTPDIWWTRTNGDATIRVVIVEANGSVTLAGYMGHIHAYGIRPALYLNLSTSLFSQFPDLTTQYLTHFDLKGGDGTFDDKYITIDSPTALPAYNGTKPGLVFKGWSTSSDATTTNYGNGATVSNLTTVGQTATLYAVWKAQVSGISIDPTNTTVTVGQTANLSATITAEPTFENITWSSSDNSLATVNSTGTVTTSNVGDVTITAKSVSDETKYATTTVHIVQQPEVAPTLALDYTNETVTGFDTDTTGFRVAGTEGGLAGASCAQVVTGTSDIASTITNSSKTLWAKKCATDGNHSDSTTTSIVIPARPVAPTISATAPSLYGLGDGYVGGLTTSEEWNATSATYDGAWTQVTGTSVDNLSAGDKVCVRTIAEAGVKFKSFGSCVTVGQGVKPAPAKPVKPKPVSTKAKKAKGSITFIWGASGFLTTVEIYYRVKGSSKWKIVRVSGADRKKIKLKRKKTYQFQLRGCKTVKGKNYYSAWTKKTVKL
jgi:hypothetical protein